MTDYDFGMTGILSGIQARGELQRQQQSAIEFPTLLATGRVDLQQKQTTLQLSNLELKRQNTEMGLLQQAIQSGKLSGQQDLSGQLNTLAEIALGSDKPAEANSYARTAADLDRQQAYLTMTKMNQAMKTAQVFSGLLSSANVHDQQSYDKFRHDAATQAAMMGSPQILKALQVLPKAYDPRTVDNLRNGWQSALQNAQQKSTEARQKAAESEVEHYQFLDRQAAAETDYYEERAKTLAKSGAGNLAAKPADIKAISDLMAQEYGDPSDLQQTQRFNTRARPVAERAKELMAQDPALKPSQAYQRAFDEAKQNGWFGGLKMAKPRLGMSAEAPAPLPASKDKAKDNTWYNVNGNPMLLMNGKLYSQQEIKSMQTQDDIDESDDDDETDEDENPADNEEAQ